MTPNQTFLALVKHDFKLRSNRRGRSSSGKWRIAYAVTTALVLIVLATLEGHRASFNFVYVWYFTYGLLFMLWGLSVGRITSEWKNATVGWWLALPMSRLKLLLSKCLAAILHAVLIFAAVYCATSLLGLYTMAVSGSFTASYAANFLLTGIRMTALFVCFSPFVAAFGTLFAVILQSVVRQALPIVWISFGGLWWLVFSRGQFWSTGSPAGLHGLHVSPIVILPIVASWVVAYLLLTLASYVLDKHVAV